jgi:predicted GNAT family N-acyltransferase
VNNLTLRFIEADTPAYNEMIDLRLKVLLAPIGIPPTYINPQKEKADYLIGAYMEGQLVGCCILTRIDEATVQLRQMAVAGAYQKKGLGRVILLFAEKTAAEKGYKTVMLHARDNVIRFYQQCGYEIKGEPFVEVGIGHYYMEKYLS